MDPPAKRDDEVSNARTAPGDVLRQLPTRFIATEILEPFLMV